MNASLSIRLPDDLLKKLDRISRETGETKSVIIQIALESYLEDYRDQQTALDRLGNKSDKIIHSKELKNSLDL
jgi:RHH-type rel operon transcriptional repressor/antitoxin RelB